MNRRTLRLISVNDVYELSNLPRLRTLIKETEASGVRFCTILAGDFLSPSILSSIDKGRAMVRCLNALPMTHVSFGNHEVRAGARQQRERGLTPLCSPPP